MYISAFKCGLKEHFAGFLHRQLPLGANFTNIFEAFSGFCNDYRQQKQISFPKSAPHEDISSVSVRTLGTFSCPKDIFECKTDFSKLKKAIEKMRSFLYKGDDLRKIRTFHYLFGIVESMLCNYLKTRL